MNKINAIVITYDGDKPSRDCIAEIASALVNNDVTTPGGLVIKHLDDNTISKILTEFAIIDIVKQPDVKIVDILSALEQDKKVRSKEEEEEDREALKAALTFLGTMFAEELKIGKETSNYLRFGTALKLHCDDDKVAKAIEIINGNASHEVFVSRTNGLRVFGNLPKSFYDKYRWTGGAIDAVRNIYMSHPRFH